MFNKNITVEQAYEHIVSKSQQMYDHRVLILFNDYLKLSNKSFSSNLTPIRLSELKPGMVIGKEMITDRGMKLLNSNVTLTQSIINKVISHSASDPIIGNIYIKNT